MIVDKSHYFKMRYFYFQLIERQKKNMNNQEDQIKQRIKNSAKTYQNFPREGVNFLDIFPTIANSEVMNDILNLFAKQLSKIEYDKIFMLQSRGFLFGVPLSLKVNKPCYPVRKKGKLPGEVAKFKYQLEYGSDQIEIQKCSINKGDKVVIIDDVLATGGTMNAAISLIQSEGGVVQNFNAQMDQKSCQYQSRKYSIYMGFE